MRKHISVAEIERSEKLLPLMGSREQVKEARRIRANLYASFAEIFRDSWGDSLNKVVAEFKYWLAHKTDADWFIAKRGTPAQIIFMQSMHEGRDFHEVIG